MLKSHDLVFGLKKLMTFLLKSHDISKNKHMEYIKKNIIMIPALSGDIIFIRSISIVSTII